MTATTFRQLAGYSYSSHSFGQVVAASGTTLFLADHGDAFPRTLRVGVMANYPTGRSVSTYDVITFNGAIGENFTGATLTGMEAGPDGALIVGSSIQHPNPPGGPLGTFAERQNVFVGSVNPSAGVQTFTWLTSVPASGPAVVSEPRIVKLSADRFAVLFSVTENSESRTEYRLMNSAGQLLTSRSFPGLRFGPGGEPKLIGSSIAWIGKRPTGFTNETFLFAIDVTNPEASTVAA